METFNLAESPLEEHKIVCQLMFPEDRLNLTDVESAKLKMKLKEDSNKKYGKSYRIIKDNVEIKRLKL